MVFTVKINRLHRELKKIKMDKQFMHINKMHAVLWHNGLITRLHIVGTLYN